MLSPRTLGPLVVGLGAKAAQDSLLLQSRRQSSSRPHPDQPLPRPHLEGKGWPERRGRGGPGLGLPLGAGQPTAEGLEPVPGPGGSPAPPAGRRPHCVHPRPALPASAPAAGPPRLPGGELG